MKFKILLFVFLFTFANAAIAQNPFTWTQLPNMPGKTANNSVSEGDVSGVRHIYSFGGIDTTKLYTGIHQNAFRYNTVTQIWDSIPSLPDTLGKIASGASTVNNIIYIFGGYHVLAGGSEVSSDRVHRYDPNTNSYLSDGLPIPKSIDDHVQCVWRDSLIFLITGWSNTGNVQDVQIYDPAGNSWQNGTMVPSTASQYACFGASGSIIGDTIYYYGGAKSGFNFPASDVLRKGVIDPTDPTNITWGLVAAGPRKAYRSSSISYGDRIFWIGGSETSYNYDGLSYFDGSGVNPSNSIFSFKEPTGNFTNWQYSDSIMDMRGIAQVSSNQWIVCGGMAQNQKVSDQTFLLEYDASYVGLKKLEMEIAVYPNPSKDNIYVDITEGISKIDIYNQLGELVITSTTEFINVSKLKTGIYLIEVQTLDQKSGRIQFAKE